MSDGSGKNVKVGVVGSRRRTSPEDKDTLRQILVRRLEKGDMIQLVSGGCPTGADRFAEELSKELKLSISIHYPDYKSLPKNPQYYDYVKIYHDRNTLIAQECDILLAFVASDRRGGTEDTIKKCELLRKKVVIL